MRPALIKSGMPPYCPPCDARYVIKAVLRVLSCAMALDSFAVSRLPPRFETTTPVGPSSIGERSGFVLGFGAMSSMPKKSDPETTIVDGDSKPDTLAPIREGT